MQLLPPNSSPSANQQELPLSCRGWSSASQSDPGSKPLPRSGAPPDFPRPFARGVNRRSRARCPPGVCISVLCPRSLSQDLCSEAQRHFPERGVSSLWQGWKPGAGAPSLRGAMGWALPRTGLLGPRLEGGDRTLRVGGDVQGGWSGVRPDLAPDPAPPLPIPVTLAKGLLVCVSPWEQ